MVALPAADAAMAASDEKKEKKKTGVISLFNKMALKAGRAAQRTHQRSDTAPPSSLQASDEEGREEKDEEDEEEQKGHPLTPPYPTTLTVSPYSLTSGSLTNSRRSHPSTVSTAFSSCSERSKHHHLLASSSSSTSSPSPPGSLWEEQPPIHPSDHRKTLLSQLSSSISGSKAAFVLMKASSRSCTSVEDAHGKAEMALAKELQTLSDLHMRLYSLVHQHHDSGIKQDTSYHETSRSEPLGPNVGYIERQDTMLKSYEGIINRFHDEIRKKDAVMKAMKETLAKSMLKGEKLERRIKALEARRWQ